VILVLNSLVALVLVGLTVLKLGTYLLGFFDHFDIDGYVRQAGERCGIARNMKRFKAGPVKKQGQGEVWER
jgi:hypothetical protein